MTSIQDDRIMALYRLARQEYAAAITDDQKQAIEQLKKLCYNGNQDAALALNQLKHLPNIHPFLREVLTA
jgi:TPR repeat protein